MRDDDLGDYDCMDALLDALLAALLDALLALLDSLVIMSTA